MKRKHDITFNRRPGRIRITVLALSLAGLLSSRADAQSAPVAATDSALRATLAGIATNGRQRIRVTTRETGRLEGNRVSVAGDSMVVTVDSQPRAIAIANVDSAWTYRGTAASIIGPILALPCAIFGGAIGGFVGGDPDSKGSSRKSALFSIIGLLAGGAVCGSLGAAIGSGIERWGLEYVRPSPNPG